MTTTKVLFPFVPVNAGSRVVTIHGHRGARGLYPENTIPGFLKAVELGVHALEMDVVISNDRQVVVSHEAWMNALFCTRPDGIAVEEDREKYNLYRMSYHEISAYDCGQRGHPAFPFQQHMAAHKPLLRDVITAVESLTHEQGSTPVIYNVEIKTEMPYGAFNPDAATFTALVSAELKKQGVLPRTHLQSFDVTILQEIKKKKEIVSIGLLVENEESLKTNLDRLGFMPQVYSPDFGGMREGLIDEAHGLGMAFIPWTVNETEDMERLLMLGVDGLITDYPDRAMHLIT